MLGRVLSPATSSFSMCKINVNIIQAQVCAGTTHPNQRQLKAKCQSAT